jgi:hypothetical protein
VKLSQELTAGGVKAATLTAGGVKDTIPAHVVWVTTKAAAKASAVRAADAGAAAPVCIVEGASTLVAGHAPTAWEGVEMPPLGEAAAYGVGVPQLRQLEGRPLCARQVAARAAAAWVVPAGSTRAG